MSSFFTTPASQRKRKRAETVSAASKKRNVAPATSKPTAAPRRSDREDSISGSESSENEADDISIDDELESGSEDEDETAAEKRLRLAEQYLENIRTEVQDDVGFDAADIDRDLIAERLKEDVAETKGKVYRKIADTLDLETASHVFGKSHLQHAITGCAVRLPFAWTISKDLVVEKWEIADPATYRTETSDRPTNVTPRRTPKRLFWRKGNKNKAKDDRNFLGHTGRIISIAVSDSGKFLATGDEDARLVIWNADSLTPLKLFTQHRAAVTSLSFRRGTEQLFSASADRTIKIWSLNELAYIETLFGHQDIVVAIAGGLETNQETCVSVGARDRTARLWKVVEESQLVFRGGGTARQKGMDKLRKGRFGGKDTEDEPENEKATISYAEGSIDVVALLDSALFVTGSDNGGLSLWSTHKKKPLFTVTLAHGRDPPVPAEEMSANANAAEQKSKAPYTPRWITAVATVPFADLVVTASWDGWIRAWKLGPEKRTLESLGTVGRVPQESENELGEDQEKVLIRGIVNGLSVYERGERGKDGLCIVAAVGKEQRLGSWFTKKARSGKGDRNGIVVFEVAKKAVTSEAEDSAAEDEQ